MPRKQTPHDGSYRRLFSHAVMVEDLIRRYVAPPWLDRLDFSTLEMVPAHYVSDELEQRESDVVWRLRYGPSGDWFYVYLLIEFQSGVFHFMAIRVLSYIMLLYEDLIRKKRLTRSGKLPPVVPIVLYNGDRRWTAPLQVSELIESLPGFRRHLPAFEYLVIDEGAQGAAGAARQSGSRGLSTGAVVGSGGNTKDHRLIDRGIGRSGAARAAAGHDDLRTAFDPAGAHTR